MSAAQTIVAAHHLLIRLSINVNHVALAAIDEADDLHLKRSKGTGVCFAAKGCDMLFAS
jgi:hypothetical protein